MNSINRTIHSATLKLTVGFLAGIMILTIGFSVLIYNSASSAFDARFETFKTRLVTSGALPQDFDFSTVRQNQAQDAHQRVISLLLYANMIIFFAGGIASLLLARRTLEPIEAMHEAQNRFTSDASHELRTPLTIMKSELENALRDKNATNEDLVETIESSLEEVDRLAKLSNTLLKLALLDDGDIHSTKLNIIDIVKYVISKTSTSEGRIKFTYPKKNTYTTANKESITELIYILIDNAIKYSPKKSLIKIKLASSRGMIRLSVTNQGDGIAEKDLQNIFQRFYRADTSRQRKDGSGSGLGLSLAKRIVELHNGELIAKSSPGKPTTMTAIIPII